jgi:styrene monooxygenase A-like protein
MTHIGIVGAGIAGLHLGLFLQQHGIDATIYTEKTAEQQRGGRLCNVVLRFAPTRERERLLGVSHWDSAAPEITRFSVSVGGNRPLAFSGEVSPPGNVVDMRIYCARLLEDFAARGGRVVIAALQTQDVELLAAEHDLMVVAAGRGSLANMFPRRPEHSPYSKPQRLAIGGLYRGIAYPQPVGFDLAASPGNGEILSLPLFSFEQGLTGIAFEIIPGGAFEVLRHLRYEDDPVGFNAAVLGLLREYAPALYQRIDPAAFALSRPLDLCHAAITPTVRQGYIRLPGGKFAMAIGDAHTVIDPLIGQGANTASHSAWVLGEAIRDSRSFDEAFCQRVEQRICAYALPVSKFCNAQLQPPKPHAVELLVAAAHNHAIADVYANRGNSPDRFWEIVSSPERTAVFLDQYGWRRMPAAEQAA